MKKLILTSTLIFSFIIIGTIVAILYARGYRITELNGKTFLEGTGLVRFTSTPEGARVYINNHFTTATDNTLNLQPGEYDVKIEKDGYFSWQKKIIVKKELVTEATATLFPITPKLEPVTISGAQNPVIDSTGTIIAYTSTSSLTTKSGVYILDMNSKPLLSLGGLTTQIAANTIDLSFSDSILSFSPDGTQLLATLSGSLGLSQYLLNPKGFNQNPTDVTTTFLVTERDWEKQKVDIQKKLFDSLPKNVRNMALMYFSNMQPSPEEGRIFYIASQSATLPIVINPRRINVNSTTEVREIREGSVYVYDMKEDRNYLVYDKKNNDSVPKFSWHPDSHHLIFVKDKTINIIEYDGQNKTTVYAGPFEEEFVYPWPDGTSIIMLTNLNISNAPQNIYRISLK